MENKKNIDMFKDLLAEIYFGGESLPNHTYHSENVSIDEINEENLFIKMHMNWKNYLDRSVDFKSLLNQYEQDYFSWKKKEHEFKEIKNDSHFLNFLKFHFQQKYVIGYKLGDISQKDIENLVYYQKPTLDKYYNGFSDGFSNFLVYNSDHLHIGLHINLESFRKESFFMTSVFSFWIEHPRAKVELEADFIDKRYENYMIARKIMDKLEVSNYRKLDLYNFEKDSQNIDQNDEISHNWVLKEPEIFITYGKQILNANPVSLFDEIVDDLDCIDIEKTKNETVFQNPDEWFENLTQDLRVFYKKGKELFLKTSRILEVSKENLKSESYEEREEIEKDEKLSFQDFLFLFNKAIDIDLEKGKPLEIAGFRTFHKLFTEFLDKESRDEKYNYIDSVSRGTFYNRRDRYLKSLEVYLEKNSELGQGGGDAYRYIRPDLIEKSKTPASTETSEVFTSDLPIQVMEKIHESIVYYENDNFKKTISILENFLDSKKPIIQKQREEYIGTLNILGKSYLERGEFENAKNLFQTIINSNSEKLDTAYNLLICLYHLNELDNAKYLGKELFRKTTAILNPYTILYKDEILYRDELRFLHYDEKDIHPNILSKDLFSKYLIMFNRNIPNYDFNFLRPKSYEGWEEYQKGLNDYEQKKKFFNKNIYGFREIKLLQIKSLNYIIESYRKKILRSFFINPEEESAIANIQSFVEFLVENLSRKRITINRINDILVFILEIAKIYYKDENNPASRVILNKFIVSRDKLKGYKYYFPEETRFIHFYLFHITRALKSNNFDLALRDIKKEITSPEFIAESALLKFIKIISCDLYKIKNQIEDQLEKIDQLKHESNENLYKPWGYEIFALRRENVDSIKDEVDYYIHYSKDNDLQEYENNFNQYLKKFKEKIKEINQIKYKGRSIVLEKIFKREFSRFQVKNRVKDIDFSKRPKKLDYKYFIEEIIAEISKLIMINSLSKLIRIKLFNSEILHEVSDEIQKKLGFPHEVSIDSDESIVKIDFKKVFDFSYKTYNFNMRLDDLVNDIILGSFETQDNEVYFKYLEENKNRYHNYFKTDFPNDLENSYFRFDVTNISDKNFYRIKITKKEVN
jgi:hypothetical protein